MTLKRWSELTNGLALAFAALFILASLRGAAQENYFEQGQLLMGEEMVQSASKFAQSAQDVPAHVTVITRADIERYGFQTLAEVLNFASAGMYTLYDHRYDFVGTRGIFTFEDYNTRLLLLLNGHVMNEPLNNFAGVGREFLVPLDLVERIEIIYGPYGVLFGTSNTGGVINVVTRQGEDLQGPAARLSGGTFRTGEAVAAFGGKTTLGGAPFQGLISANQYESDGPNTGFPRRVLTPADPWYGPVTWNGGYAWGGSLPKGADMERAPSAFASFSWGDWWGQARLGYRKHVEALAPWGDVYGDANNYVQDERNLAEVGWSHAFTLDQRLSVTAAYDEYRFTEKDTICDPSFFPGLPGYYWRDRSSGYRTSGEVLWNGKRGAWSWVAGAHVQSEHILDVVDLLPVGGVRPALLDHRLPMDQSAWSGYALAEWEPVKGSHLSLAANYVKYSYTQGTWLYRLAWVERAAPKLTLKAVIGKGFRAPSWYEYGYWDNISSLPNPTLVPETSPAAEFSVGWEPSSRIKVEGSLFWQKTQKFIESKVIDSPGEIQGNVIPPGQNPADYVGYIQYQNLRDLRTYGASFSTRISFGTHVQGYANLSWQEASFDSDPLTRRLRGSPDLTGNLGLAGAVGPFSWSAGAAYLGPMFTSDGRARPPYQTAGTWDTRVRLAWNRIANRPLRLELLVTNVLDSNQQVPLSSAFTPETARRSWRGALLSVVYNF